MKSNGSIAMPRQERMWRVLVSIQLASALGMIVAALMESFKLIGVAVAINILTSLAMKFVLPPKLTPIASLVWPASVSGFLKAARFAGSVLLIAGAGTIVFSFAASMHQDLLIVAGIIIWAIGIVLALLVRRVRKRLAAQALAQ